MDEGAVNFPGDIQEAISFIAHRNTQEILGFWRETIAKLTKRANRLTPDLIRIRSTLSYEGGKYKIQAPSALAELTITRIWNGRQRLD